MALTNERMELRMRAQPGWFRCSQNGTACAKRGCLIKSQPLCKMHSSNSRAVHFAPPAGGLLNAQGAQGRPLHTSPAKFLCIFLSCCYFETTRFCSLTAICNRHKRWPHTKGLFRLITAWTKSVPWVLRRRTG